MSQRIERRPEHDEYDTEWNRWQDVLDALLERGVLTLEDLKRPVGDDSTPGCRLLNVLRRWGDAQFEIGER